MHLENVIYTAVPGELGEIAGVKSPQLPLAALHELTVPGITCKWHMHVVYAAHTECV